MIDAIADGVPARSLKDELSALESEQDKLRRLIAEAADAPNMPLLHPNMAELYRSKVADLHRALLDDATRAEAVEILRSLVDAIVLTPSGCELTITLRGDLAGILSLGKRNKQPGSSAGTGLDHETQVSLVAGARNLLDLLLNADGVQAA